MFRTFLELLGAFALPFLAYTLWQQVRRLFTLPKKQFTRDLAFMLTFIGLLLCAALILATFLYAERSQGAYQPAHIENGQIVPGHLD